MNRHDPKFSSLPPTRANRRGILVASTFLAGLVTALSLGTTATAQTLPTGGTVVGGAATVVTTGNTMTVNQSTRNVILNWNSFSIGSGSTVNFVQPDASSVALNRVLGADPSVIMGNLNSNGQVFLINPNGILFGRGAQVNVGGLVASTMGISDADFMAGGRTFAGRAGSVVNEGAINSSGGYVALLGGQVVNNGAIQARLGTIVMAAGEAVTLDFAGDGLLNVVVDTGAVGALVSNGGLLQADGGYVIMTTQGAGALLNTVVNNTGIIQARTVGQREGTILLLADMASGTVNVGGTLDASAPDSGDGGFIETSAGTVRIADGVRISTEARSGRTGTWLIDPQDFTIGAGGNISGATLSAQLVTTNVVISTLTGVGASLPGNGDIHVNDAIAWTASGEPTTLTLNASRDVNINASITATNGNLVACCGRDVNVNAPITTVNGSVLLNAGRDVRVFHAITTTDGNIALCAGHDVHIDAAVTLTRGTTIPAQSLGLPLGLTIIAGADGTGPGPEGGTIIFAPLTPPITVTNAPATLNYNPISYAAPTDYSIHFVLTEGATLTQRMLLFPDGGRVFDGTTATTLTGFRTTAASGLPGGVNLVAGPGATATFDSATVGADVGITYSGYSLTGPDAGNYALAGSCCVSTFRTRGTIAPAPVTPPVTPPVVPPVTPPVVPPVTPPVVPPVTPVGPYRPSPTSPTTGPGSDGDYTPGLDLVVVDGGVTSPGYPAIVGPGPGQGPGGGGESPPTAPSGPDVGSPTGDQPSSPDTPTSSQPAPDQTVGPDTAVPYPQGPRPLTPVPERPRKQDRN